MNRRGFLQRAGGTVAAVAAAGALARVAAAGDTPDEFMFNGYRVKWSDWNKPVNQNVVFGMWLAKHERQDNEYVSTTLGQCYPNRGWEVVDLSLADGWPKLTIFATDAEKAAVKQRALDALKKELSKV